MSRNADLEVVQHGTFKVGEKLVVSDPCYTRDTWCAIYNITCAPGTWVGKTLEGEASGWGHRVWELLAFHENASEQGPWEKYEGEVGVDSGQAGIFNDDLHPRGEIGEYGDLDSFYGRACAATMDQKDPSRRAGVITEGIVSSSGYGDGGYTLFVKRDDEGRVNACRVVFIDDEGEG